MRRVLAGANRLFRRARFFVRRVVSFDRDRDKWLAAVKDNGMDWIHVSELQQFDNRAAKDYAVQGIPSNFLIDAQGVIVAKNLRGEDLYKKVEELLGK